jgi:hypothetical protein
MQVAEKAISHLHEQDSCFGHRYSPWLATVLPWDVLVVKGNTLVI